MKYIIFSELNKNHFLFLTYFILSFIIRLISIYIKTIKDVVQIFHLFYIYTLSDFLSIILFFIIKVRSKGMSKTKFEKGNINEENKKISSDLPNIIQNKYLNDKIKNQKKRMKRIIKLTILVSILNFLALNIQLTFYIIVEKIQYVIKSMTIHSHILFNILSKYILSIIILHLNIYKHHYLSLALNFIFLVVLVIYDILSVDEIRTYFYMLMKIVIVILFSFENVYAKVLLSIDSISPYSYLLYRGILVNFLSLLYSIVFIFVEIPDEFGKESIVFTRFGKLYQGKLKIFLYVLLLFVKYLSNLNILLIIDKFSPIHFAVASIMDNITSLLIAIIYKKIEIKVLFIILSLYLFLILASLIYNEFIILNFCGFQTNTQLFLQKKANNDLEQAILSHINDNSYSEDRRKTSEMINIGDSNYEIKKDDFIENKNSEMIE